MAFKTNPNKLKKGRLVDMSKTALIKTVRTLQRRETTLLNKIARLEGGQADRLLDNLAVAVEVGYRAGEKGVDNLEMTLAKWHSTGKLEAPTSPRPLMPETDEHDAYKHHAARFFPWEPK